MSVLPAQSRPYLTRQIAGAVILVALGIAIAFTTFRRIETTAAARRHTRLVLNAASTILARATDAESSMRGFVLTGDERFLEPYRAVRDSLEADLHAVRAMSRVPAARARLTTFAPVMAARLAQIDSTIALRRLGVVGTAAVIAREADGDRLMRLLRTEMRAFMEIQEAAQVETDAAFETQLRRLFTLLMAISILALLIAAALVAMAARAAQQHIQRLVHLETERLLLLQEETSRQLQSANTTLQLSEERLSVTLNSIGDAVIATDAQGRVTQLNPLAARLSGWTHLEALGHPVEEVLILVNEETRLPTPIPVAETLVTGTPQALANHTVLISRHGTECPIADSCAPIRDREGQVVGAVLVFRDVTEEYAAQRALRDTNTALELARAEADRANVAKSDFLSNMSHEIRTPMNAIIGMSYLALKSDLTPRQRENIRTIQDSGRHLLNIINDILDISKIEAGKLTVESTDFALEQVLDNITSLIAAKADAKGLELIFDIAKDVPPNLIGDPLRLGQVLINYSNNAVKFTEHGEVDIVVTVQDRTDDSVALHFAVRDTGIGLSPAEISRLFQSFSQADASTTRRFGGTGLGLVISKNLAELMGGTVGVDSVVGSGSTFWFSARFGIGKGHPQPLALTSNHRGLRALVVDDNLTARVVLSELLASLTFAVDQVDSGSAALTAVSDAEQNGQPYAIVLLDWQMPRMDGIETARRMRALQLEHAPHMMMVTAYGREEVIEGAGEVGIERVLIKPVSASSLFDGVSRILGGIVVESPSGSVEVRLDLAARLATLRGTRVLLVEDNDVNQQVATELLQDAGFVVDLAENGQVALDRLHAAHYDVVLMDMQMPVMDGVTATMAIRQEARFANLPIIAMTANAMQVDRDRCLAAGMNAHVAKPIEPDDLWAAMLEWTHPTPSPAIPKTAPPTVVTRGDTELPTGIEGLDSTLGLRRGLGKHALYRSMLRSFVAGQRNAAGATRTALNENDWPAAERAAHTLKSVAANVGATDVQELARALEAAIRDTAPRSTIDAHLTALEGPLTTLMAQLTTWLPQLAPVTTLLAAENGVPLAPALDVPPRATVLIVDDSVDNLTLMSEVLRGTYEVQQASDGESALRLAFSDTPPDLILLDIMMERMDGYEVCRRLCADPRSARIPVIFLTARTDEEDERQGLEIGAVDYLVKPVSAPIVLARVHTHLALKALSDALREQNVELALARTVADKANGAKSEFLSRMSHELRSPLTAILGFAQLMETDVPPPSVSQQASLTQILNGGWYLLKLINELLDLAAIESGKMTPVMESVALGAFVRECTDLTSELAHKRAIVIDVAVDAPLLRVQADRTRLKQVLINLLSNAIKYNRPSGSVTVRWQPCEPAAVRLSVTDTGLGLSAEQLGHLFESFNRLGREAIGEQGTGIGLAVSRRLVELMGGRIGVESTEGVGSTFWVELAADGETKA